MDINSNIQQMREFILLYNRITETCSNLCTTNMHKRELGPEELNCVRRCTEKHINVNHKVMAVYAELQPMYIQRRLDEMMGKH
ncbi:UNVERIFIED_CONTAM: hypothetical protein RMT77_007077 [Armadillidium vulgare]|nr:Mitochondrial import inner membrane translocase subunit Tim10 B [Armadillidium vulgare]